MTDQQQDQPTPPRALRALVVDDAPTVRMYHGGLLRRAGFEVAEAGNGVEALEMALQEDYDLYVVDVNMPLMDGQELVRSLRAPVSVGTSAPVVAVSTEAEAADVDAMLTAGAVHYLVKPVRPEAFCTVADALTAPLPPTWSPS